MRAVTIIFKSLYACQHKCGFCHVLHVPRNTSYMSTEAVKATFDRIAEQYAGCRIDLDMSGGEFSLRKDAVELITYLRAKDLHISSLVLDTMAVPLADAGLARELGGLFTKVNVSVHAPDAATHAAVSASSTEFGQLRAGLVNIFRYFPAVFTNTSINGINWDRLRDIAKFVLQARFAAGRETPLYCAYYLPVYRRYGESGPENRRRLQGVDNTGFLPDGRHLDPLRAEFERARALLALHGVSAQVRDFNYPACVYQRLTGRFPEHAYGLPNFMNDAYFTDYDHPIEAEFTLEEVYPSMDDRTKVGACRGCIVESLCPGITREWQRRGYQAEPVSVADYTAGFAERLLNRTLQGVFHDPIRITALVDELAISWESLARSFFEELAAGRDLLQARAHIAQLSPAERGLALSTHLRSSDSDAARTAALAIEQELAHLAALARRSTPAKRPRPRHRLPVLA